jgi:putative iron-dependent peroxidase
LFEILGGDLLVHIRSNRKDLCFELGLQFCRLIPDECIDKLDDTFGFAYMSSLSNGLSKDFIGFEDGNANPKNDQQRVFYCILFYLNIFLFN